MEFDFYEAKQIFIEEIKYNNIPYLISFLEYYKDKPISRAIQDYYYNYHTDHILDIFLRYCNANIVEDFIELYKYLKKSKRFNINKDFFVINHKEYTTSSSLLGLLFYKVDDFEYLEYLDIFKYLVEYEPDFDYSNFILHEDVSMKVNITIEQEIFTNLEWLCLSDGDNGYYSKDSLDKKFSEIIEALIKVKAFDVDAEIKMIL